MTSTHSADQLNNAENPDIGGGILNNRIVLPSLPLPSLEETSRRFIEWCEPLLDADELAATKNALASFVRKGGPGERLHAALAEYNRRPDVKSWLDAFWQSRYLGRRDRIALNANGFCLFPESSMTQTARAAALIASTLCFKRTVDEKRLPVERWRGRALSMTQYLHLFSTTRIPGVTQDTVRTPYSSAQAGPSQARHISVFHKGHIVRMDVIGPKGQPHALQEIERGLDTIKASIMAAAATAESAGHLTTMARAEWAAARAELISAHPDNIAALETIETALFNICLDEAAPAGALAVCNNLLYGSSANRWYDSAISIIVTANGAAGINAEHSMHDGMALVGFADALHDLSPEEASTRSGAVRQGLPAFEQVTFHLSDALRIKIGEAAGSFKAYGDATASTIYSFDEFGSNRVKELGLSPDAFVQLALQLAHVRTKGFAGATYESIATRQFDHGRTEAMRVVTEEILQFVAAMQNVAATHAEKIAALRAAAEKHVRRAKECQDGQAPEQHLWELMLIQKRQGEALGVTEDLAVFKSPGWLKMRYDYLSTSSLLSRYVPLFGFGSTSPDCIGFGYAVRSNGFSAYLSTAKSSAHYLPGFVANLRGAMFQLCGLLQSEACTSYESGVEA
jgi:carnitine O-acetyltransferase